MQIRFLIFFAIIFLMNHATAASPVCVTASKVTMRAEPNAKAPVTWVVTKNMPLMRLIRKGSWTQVEDVDGEKHWLPSNSVSGRVPCAVVKVKVAKLRRAPSLTAPLAEMTIADKYTPFRRVGGEGEFIEVLDEYNERYWISDRAIWYPVKKMEITF